MTNINLQEEIFDEIRTLICSAPETPVRMTEQIANVMATQWVRGSAWALEHARAFRDEVKARVAGGIAAYPGERLRLMWVGAGLWHDTDFYTAFEASHGAVFVWSMYLAFGPDGYIRYGLDDPLAALASRTAASTNSCTIRRGRPSGSCTRRSTIALTPRSCCARQDEAGSTGRLFIGRRSRTGNPSAAVEADVVDARSGIRPARAPASARFSRRGCCSD